MSMFTKTKHFVKVQNSVLFMTGIYDYFNYSQANRLFPRTCLWINLPLMEITSDRDIACIIKKHAKGHAQPLYYYEKVGLGYETWDRTLTIKSTLIGTSEYDP